MLSTRITSCAEVGERLDGLGSDHEPAEVGHLDAGQRLRVGLGGNSAVARWGYAVEVGEHFIVVLSPAPERGGVRAGTCRSPAAIGPGKRILRPSCGWSTSRQKSRACNCSLASVSAELADG